MKSWKCHARSGREGGAVPIRTLLVLAAVLAALTLVVRQTHDPDPARSADTGADTVDVANAAPLDAARQDSAAPWSEADWEIFTHKVAWARSRGLDTLQLGESMARLGRSFVGTPYVPKTLEAAGPEHLVVDFREFDCVTFVENTFALARFLRTSAARHLDQRAAAQAAYDRILTQIRYRGGKLDGYPSRLHYFSDWISDGVAKGLVANVTRELGGVQDTSRIDFMTTHASAYRQLADPVNVTAMRSIETRLSREGRPYIPQNAIGAASRGIRNGDIIAVTSTLPGLDIAHTGLAIRVDGEVHLLNAPLVGASVQISEKPLGERVQGISSQDGIMVARPLGG